MSSDGMDNSPPSPSASAIVASRPIEQTYFGKPYLTRLPNELLLMVADELKKLLPHQEYPEALARLCLVDKHLHALFEPRLYALSGLNGRPCAITWAACKGEVATMAKAATSSVNIHTVIKPHQLDKMGIPPFLRPIDPRAVVIAVAFGHHACVEWLLNHGANIDDGYEAKDFNDIYIETPRFRLLFWAIRFNQPLIIQLLLARGVGPLLSIQAPQFKPMHIAAALRLVVLFDTLLAIPGSTIDEADHHEYTPLYYAVTGVGSLCRSTQGWLEHEDDALSAIQSLLRRGANRARVNGYGETALEVSIPRQDSRWKAALLLLKEEQEDFVPSELLITKAVIGSEKSGHGDQFLRRLLVGPPVSRLYSARRLRNPVGDSPAPLDDQTSLLLWSIFEYKLIWARELPRFMVEQDPEYEVPVFLLGLGATPSLADSQGRTPLHACISVAIGSDAFTWQRDPPASEDGTRPFPFNVIAALLERSASLDTLDNDNRTPLDYAVDVPENDWAENDLLPRPHDYVQAVVRITLRMAYEAGMCPSDAVKKRIVARFGRDVLHPEDKLAAME